MYMHFISERTRILKTVYISFVCILLIVVYYFYIFKFRTPENSKQPYPNYIHPSIGSDRERIFARFHKEASVLFVMKLYLRSIHD